jgi:cell division transport system permease protein
MKLISFFRVLKFGFSNFYRNIWLSIATTLVMMLTLFTVSSLVILNIIGESALNSVKEKVDISVYLNSEIKENEISEIENDLLTMPEIKSYEFISKEKALEQFKEKHQDDSLVISSINELDKNPLQASFVVKARYPEDYAIISSSLKESNYKEKIEKITFEDNENVINKIDTTTNFIEKVGVIVSLVFSFITAIFMFNTIRLAIYSQKEEIRVMKLIGAKNLFIRMPFFIESIFYALIASILSSIVLFVLFKYSYPYIIEFIGSEQLDAMALSNQKIFYLVFVQLVTGILLSIISTYIAIRKYLRV